MAGTQVLAHLEPTPQLLELLNTPLNLGVVLAGVAIAFGLGAFHALSPGHGKTLVGAYLVGAKGTPHQALLLGITTTVTHTLGVFVLGFLALFAAQYVDLDQLYPVLELISGLAVCGVGARLLYIRLGQGHDHDPDHDHGHSHDHGHHHHHPPLPQRDLPALIALGISGGLVPCPSALVLLLSAIALHHIAFGLVLVSGFSLGLASVLTGLGLMAVYASRWLDRLTVADGLVQRLSVVSAAVVIAIGLSLTTVSVLT
ncbi:MAG: high frequency lysogenization protein HflD [Leptolyngbya sp. LCM1.Bin17]|nr:MAG: high frequency lysogenization protein HflD [Leptolyngbya sp. LCM1.Bin17]